jgi:hypothetical protein
VTFSFRFDLEKIKSPSGVAGSSRMRSGSFSAARRTFDVCSFHQCLMLARPPSLLRCMSLLMAQMRSAGCIRQCPLSGVTRKTCARAECFSV